MASLSIPSINSNPKFNLSGMRISSATLEWPTWLWTAEVSPTFSPLSHLQRRLKLSRWIFLQCELKVKYSFHSPRSWRSRSRQRSQQRKQFSSLTDSRDTSWKRRQRIWCWTPVRTLLRWQWQDWNSSARIGEIQRFTSVTSGGGKKMLKIVFDICHIIDKSWWIIKTVKHIHNAGIWLSVGFSCLSRKTSWISDFMNKSESFISVTRNSSGSWSLCKG